MERPESSPAYIAHCVETFLEAIREAQVLAADGRMDELAESLRFASHLLDVIAEGLDGQEGAAAPLADVKILRGMLQSACGLLGGSLH